jgi:hypothetical protein
MRERQQVKEAAKASAPPQQQALPHPAMRTGASSTVSNASSKTAQTSNTSVSKLEEDNKSKLERDAKARKERFLMFTRVLMKYLEQKDPGMHARAKAVIRECADKNKNKERGYESVTASMQKRLKDMVGEAYWTRAEAYLNHFLKQKEKMVTQKKQEASSSHQQQPVPAVPPKTQQQVQEEKQRLANIEGMRREIEKKKVQFQSVATAQQRKAQQLPREQQTQVQHRSREQDMIAVTRKAASEPVKKKKADVKRRASPSSSTISPMPAAATAASRMTPVPLAEVKEPPLREYNDLMDLVDHAVDYNWTSAALLLGNEAIGDVNLNDEQKKLLYAEKPSLLGQERKAKLSTAPSSQPPASMRGWGMRNVLSARGAWARVRLPEQRKQSAEAGIQVPIVAGLRLPTASQTAPEAPKLTPEAIWFNDKKAEDDATLWLLSDC